MEELIQILKGVKPGVDFENETALIDNGILDSLDIITIIAEIFDEFDITVPTNYIIPENFNSANRISFIKKLNQKICISVILSLCANKRYNHHSIPKCLVRPF